MRAALKKIIREVFVISVCCCFLPAYGAGNKRNPSSQPVTMPTKKLRLSPVVQPAPQEVQPSMLPSLMNGLYRASTEWAEPLVTPSVIKDLTGNDAQTDRSVPKRRKKNQVRKRLAQVRPTCNKPETCNTETNTSPVTEPSTHLERDGAKDITVSTVVSNEPALFRKKEGQNSVSASLQHEPASILPSVLNAFFCASGWEVASLVRPAYETRATQPLSVPDSPALTTALLYETRADDDSPFPQLTLTAHENLLKARPAMKQLHEYIINQYDPLENSDSLFQFIKSLPEGSEDFCTGNHSLIMLGSGKNDDVFKIARSENQDNFTRFEREVSLYRRIKNRLEADHPLVLHTCPMRGGFLFAGKRVIAMQKLDFIVNNRLDAMGGRSLFDRLDFALTWLWRFCEVYLLFLEQDILLADRHGSNIGFNEITLAAMPALDYPGGRIRFPVMLDLDPYWEPDDHRTFIWRLPPWVPVAMDVLERAFLPYMPTEGRRKTLNRLRQQAMPCSPHAWSGDVPDLPDAPACAPSSDSPEPDWYTESLRAWQNGQTEDRLTEEVITQLEALFRETPGHDSTTSSIDSLIETMRTETKRVLAFLQGWKAKTDCTLFFECQDAPQEASNTDASTAPGSPTNKMEHFLRKSGGELVCLHCPRTFTLTKRYKKHLEAHDAERLIECDICKGYYRDLKSHQRIHSGDKPYKCERCGKGFTQSGNLATHQRIHSGDKPYKCEHCGKGFNHSGNLATHQRTHSGDKPYKCEHCGKRFGDSANLTAHQRTHSGDKPYKCELCGKRFTTSSSLTTHQRTHSGDKPYKCELCGKGFTQSGHLAAHERIHSGDKPYKCEHCGKGFTQSSSLATHLRTHSGDKPYKCEHCGKRFNHSGNKSNHQKKCLQKPDTTSNNIPILIDPPVNQINDRSDPISIANMI